MIRKTENVLSDAFPSDRRRAGSQVVMWASCADERGVRQAETLRSTTNERVISFLMPQPASSAALCAADRKSLRGSLNVLICGALMATSSGFKPLLPAKSF